MTANEERALALTEVKVDGNFPVNIRNMEDMKLLGQMLAASGFFKDTTQVAQAVVKVLAGAEVGIGPVASMTNIYIVKGRTAFSANLIGSQIKRHPGYDYKVKELTDKICTITFWERDPDYSKWTELGEYAFSIEDAARAGLTGKDNWTAYPRAMLFARALSAGARTYCPDVFYSHVVYTPEELNPDLAVDEGGDVIEGQFKEDRVIVEDHETSTKTQEPETLDEAIEQAKETSQEDLEELIPEETVEKVRQHEEKAKKEEPIYPPGRPWLDPSISIPAARDVLYGIAVVEWGYEDVEDVRITVADAGKWTTIPDTKTLDEIANYIMAQAPSYAPPSQKVEEGD